MRDIKINMCMATFTADEEAQGHGPDKNRSLYHMTYMGLVMENFQGSSTHKKVLISCMLKKMHKDRILKYKITSTTGPLQLIHWDLSGSIRVVFKT